MNIIYLVGGLGRGGTEKQLYLNLKNLDAKNYKIDVFALNKDIYDSYKNNIEQLGFNVQEIPSEYNGFIKKIFFIYKIIKRKQYDVIHSWSFYANPLAALLAYLCSIKLCIGSARADYKSYMKKLSWVHRFLSVQLVDLLLVNSINLRDTFIKNGLSTKKVVYLPNCLDENFLFSNNTLTNRKLNKYNIMDLDIIVGMVGNFRLEKNHMMFIKAIQEIKNPKVKGMIIGQEIKGHERVINSIKSMLDRRGLNDRIILAGYKRDIKDYLKFFKILCLTSDTEGFPNIIIESMAIGTPVVSTDVGDVSRIIKHKEEGYIVKRNDYKEMSRYIEILINEEKNYNDISKAATNKITTLFNSVNAKKKLEKIYHSYEV